MSGAVARAVTVWRAAQAQDKARPRIERRGPELEFLPAAVEVLETPASPAGRSVVGLIVLLFLIAVAWAWLGHIDTVAVAQGRIIPGGRVKVIQPLEAGVVRRIHVDDGQQVAAGELLIELDPTESGADLERLARDLMAARLDVARLRAVASGAKDPVAAFVPMVDADPALVATGLALLRGQIAEQQAKLGALQGEIAQRRAEQVTLEASIARQDAMIPPLWDRFKARRILAAKGYGSKAAYRELEQELAELRGDREVEKGRLAESRAAVETLRRRRTELETAFLARVQEELAESLLRAAGLGQELRKAEERFRLRRLEAPVAGVVQQLAVHTVGGVVTPAERLLVIVPDDSPLEIEAMVLNKDVGFVEAGQAAEIKVESFPFTKYGLIDGSVRQVSRDSVAEQETGNLVYPARVTLARSEILVSDRWVKLSPGMSVTVEVKTGKRRVMEFFLSPFLEYQDEALRER